MLEEFENFKLDSTQAETGTDELLWTRVRVHVVVCDGLIGQAGMMPSQAAFQAECGPSSHLTYALIHILICDVMPAD